MTALEKLAEIHYDAIFLDQMMPNLDGIQTLKLAKEMPENKSKNSPIIALTDFKVCYRTNPIAVAQCNPLSGYLFPD